MCVNLEALSTDNIDYVNFCELTLNDQANSKGIEKPLVTTHDGLTLKQLSEHLRYTFMGEDSTFPVIISTYLSQDEKERPLDVLTRHKSALSWSLSNVKGIRPTICMHKIMMEEYYMPSIEHQKRFNLPMKEVVCA